MLEQEKIEEWHLQEWWDRVDKVEDEVIKIVRTKRVEMNIDRMFITNYGKLVLSIREILTLLKNGYPDGALSIARTVYEIMILTKFIYQKYEEDNDTDLIERYFADHNVKVYKHYLNYYKRLYKNTLDGIKIENSVDDLKTKIGCKVDEYETKLKELREKYKKIDIQYWWASKEFKGRVNFQVIDNSTNDECVLRMLYERACVGIHASALGTYALLGRENEFGNIIYTTPTDSGFEAPLLLGMVSHDMFVEMLCKYFEAKSEIILSNSSDLDVYELYNEYVGRI